MMITIKVNEVMMEVEDKFNISQLLKHTNSAIDGIAVAINNEIISKSNWETKQLLNNDNILIIQATQGG